MSNGIARTNSLQEVQPPTWSTACSQPVCPFADNTLRTDMQVKTCWLHAVPLHIVIPTNCGFFQSTIRTTCCFQETLENVPPLAPFSATATAAPWLEVNFFKGASSTAKTAAMMKFHVKKRHHRLSTKANSRNSGAWHLPIKEMWKETSAFHITSTEPNHHTRESSRLHRKHTVTQGRSNLSKGVVQFFKPFLVISLCRSINME